jgi:ATP-dependent protease ClpP protease subunit
MKFKIIAAVALFALTSLGCVEQYDNARVDDRSGISMPSVMNVMDGEVFIMLDFIDQFTFNAMRDASFFIKQAGLKKVRILMCNPGGSVFHMWAIYDLVTEWKKSGVEVNTSTTGLVASAAVPIFLLGENRTITENGWVMIHPHSGDESSYNHQTVNAMFREWTEKYAKVLAGRTKILLADAMDMLTGDHQNDTWFFNASEALKLGIATEIK